MFVNGRAQGTSLQGGFLAPAGIGSNQGQTSVFERDEGEVPGERIPDDFLPLLNQAGAGEFGSIIWVPGQFVENLA